jgi:hypothetical protein
VGSGSGAFSGWRYHTLIGGGVKRKTVRLYTPCLFIPYTEFRFPRTMQSQCLAELHRDRCTNPQQSHSREFCL